MAYHIWELRLGEVPPSKSSTFRWPEAKLPPLTCTPVKVQSVCQKNLCRLDARSNGEKRKLLNRSNLLDISFDFGRLPSSRRAGTVKGEKTSSMMCHNLSNMSCI